MLNNIPPPPSRWLTWQMSNPVCSVAPLSTTPPPIPEVGSSLLRHPSPELSRLISAHGSLSKGERNFQWPVLAFVIQHHDLEGLEVAMRHALRKSACRVFAMEVRPRPRRRRARCGTLPRKG